MFVVHPINHREKLANISTSVCLKLNPFLLYCFPCLLGFHFSPLTARLCDIFRLKPLKKKNRGFDSLVKETSECAEIDLMFHYFQNFSSDAQHFDDFYCSEKSNTCLTSGISDYDLGGEWDLFKAPQPIIEPPLVTLDHMTSAMSLILCGEDLVSQDIKFANIGLPEFEDFMSDPFYENKDIILAKESSSPSQILNTNNIIEKENVHPVGKITKSVSSDSLTSMNGGGQSRSSSMNFTDNESEKVHGMRRAFSEGYIKPQLINDHISETRMQQLSRYRDKKTKRNFRRKIKYACRKALADSQPRIRGRFAKTEETST